MSDEQHISKKRRRRSKASGQSHPFVVTFTVRKRVMAKYQGDAVAAARSEMLMDLLGDSFVADINIEKAQRTERL